MTIKPKEQSFEVIKSTGMRVKFSLNKLKGSLHKSGADEKTIKQIRLIVLSNFRIIQFSNE